MKAIDEVRSVTVIIPVYNGEELIRRALDSVLRQTHPASQILVIDDGSKDATTDIVEQEYGSTVTLIRQQNGGPAKARNAGIRVATGEFVAFLDADDFWKPEKLETQLKALELHPEAVCNYSGLYFVDEYGVHIGDGAPIDVTTLWPQLRWCNPGVPPTSAIVRRSALSQIGGFSELQSGSEDWDLWFRLIALGPFCTCPEPLSCYRVSPGGLSGNADHMFNDFMKMLDNVLLAEFSGVSRRMWRRRIISYQAYKGCLTARAAGNRARERFYVMKSLATWPSPFWAPERFKAFVVTLLGS